MGFFLFSGMPGYYPDAFAAIPQRFPPRLTGALEMSWVMLKQGESTWDDIRERAIRDVMELGRVERSHSQAGVTPNASSLHTLELLPADKGWHVR